MPEISTSFSSKLFYRKMGTGPAVVLIHGFPESGKLWEEVWDYLSVSNTLIIPDLPGSEFSPLKGKVSLSQMADGVKAILDAEEIEHAVIAGHSMGGYIAFAFADHYPASVSGLCLVHSTPAADDEDKIAVRRKAIDIIEKGGKELFLRQMVTGLFGADFKQRQPSVIEAQIASSATMPAQSLINFYQAMIERPSRVDMLDRATFPIQWILGEEDTVTPVKKVMPYCHKSRVNFLELYNGCGHMSMLEHPKKLQADLKTFADYCFSAQYH